jgi:hypothetical protein
MTTPTQITANSVEELHEQLERVPLKKHTLLYVSDLAHENKVEEESVGLALALAAVNAALLEKAGKRALSVTGEWTLEELRTSFLEGLSEHVLDFFKWLAAMLAALHVGDLHPLAFLEEFPSLLEFLLPCFLVLTVYLAITHVRTSLLRCRAEKAEKTQQA